MGGGRVTMIVSPSRDAAVAVLDGLPTLGNGKTYQLWMLGDAPARDVGLSAGNGRFYIKGLANQFGVSREPKGGSKTPTLTQIVGKLDIR
jgi:hypothetical protein